MIDLATRYPRTVAWALVVLYLELLLWVGQHATP